jgi:SAM-dependent methyltransferase
MRLHVVDMDRGNPENEHPVGRRAESSMSSLRLQRNTELQSLDQSYNDDPLADRATDLYRREFVKGFAEKWDELIDWDARAKSEGQFFIDVLRGHGKESVLDAATGTGFHSVRLTEAGFDVISVDGSAAMLAKAFENGQKRGLILKTVQADWRELNRSIHGKYDAIICLGNSFTHLHDEQDRRKALAEFYAALRHDGILILDQRNYDEMLDHGLTSTHKYYYCGDRVTAEPEYLDDGLARFQYTFPDGCEYTLNMFPLRKNYVRRLMREAGFELVRTYGDFHETYQEREAEFFIHVAQKSVTSSCQLRERRIPSSHRRHRHLEEVHADRRRRDRSGSPRLDTTVHDGQKRDEKWLLKTCCALQTGIGPTNRSPFSGWAAAFRAGSTHQMICGSCYPRNATRTRSFPPTAAGISRRS